MSIGSGIVCVSAECALLTSVQYRCLCVRVSVSVCISVCLSVCVFVCVSQLSVQLLCLLVCNTGVCVCAQITLDVHNFYQNVLCTWLTFGGYNVAMVNSISAHLSVVHIWFCVNVLCALMFCWV